MPTRKLMKTAFTKIIREFSFLNHLTQQLRKTDLPQKSALLQNYPNPFNPSTTIAFQLHKPAKVEIEVYNILGQKVATVIDKFYNAGIYKIKWDATNDYGGRLTSGIYLYRLKAGKVTQVKKLLLLR